MEILSKEKMKEIEGGYYCDCTLPVFKTDGEGGYWEWGDGEWVADYWSA